MTLTELILSVKEQHLTKDQLEGYRDQMAQLFAEMNMEMADLEKDEALFMNEREDGEAAISRKIAWKATAGGQRLIVLKRYATATKAMLSSLKDRLYNYY